MLQCKSITAHEMRPLGYLISTPKAFPILLAHKFRDARVQHLLTRSSCILLAIVCAGVGVCEFNLVPTFWALSAFASGIFLLALFLSIGADNLFLQFALEDKRFFEMATISGALSVFEDEDQSLPQPEV